MPYTQLPKRETILWGEIKGEITRQDDLKNLLGEYAPAEHNHTGLYQAANPAINEHLEDEQNPHCVTKGQVGLALVSNDTQLKRANRDFTTFAEKIQPSFDDLLLIEDADADYYKRKITLDTVFSMLTFCHNFEIKGEVKIANGDIDYIPPAYLDVPAGKRLKIVGCTTKINSGGLVVFDLLAAGSPLLNYSNISTGTTENSILADSQAIDARTAIAPVITQVNAQPMNMSIAIYYKYE